MNNIEFVDKLKDVLKHKTLYVMGCFGAPLTTANKKRYSSNNSYNKIGKVSLRPHRQILLALTAFV